MPEAFTSEFKSPREAIDTFFGRLSGETTLLIAVSGGSDSLGLLLLLHEAVARPERRHIRLVAATVDHGLRAEGAAEAAAVARLCGELSIPHMSRRWEAEKRSGGVSAAAREARYRLLMEAAEIFRADAILTAHTADDQLETVAMRAARSDMPGNLGLAGMADAVLLDFRVWLLRPLLQTRREAIRKVLREQGRWWVDDPSNADPNYERVRVRQSLASGAAVVSLQEITAAGEARSRLSANAADIVRRHLSVHHGVLAQLAVEAMSEEPQAVRHGLATLAAILGGRPHLPGTATMDRVTALLDNSRLGRTTAGRVIFDLRRDALFMHRESRDLPSLHLLPGRGASWDDRYHLDNASADELLVVPTPPDRDLAIALFAGCPPAVAMRAMGVMPHVENISGGDLAVDKATVIVRRTLAPFDRFLPRFELALASEMALLFGCNAIPAAPINVFGRKN